MTRAKPLLGALAILLATGAALALTGAGGDRAHGPADAARGGPRPAIERDELARISVATTPEVARRVERIRGLEFDGVPRPEVVTSADLRHLS